MKHHTVTRKIQWMVLITFCMCLFSTGFIGSSNFDRNAWKNITLPYDATYTYPEYNPIYYEQSTNISNPFYMINDIFYEDKNWVVYNLQVGKTLYQQFHLDANEFYYLLVGIDVCQYFEINVTHSITGFQIIHTSGVNWSSKFVLLKVNEPGIYNFTLTANQTLNYGFNGFAIMHVGNMMKDVGIKYFYEDARDIGLTIAKISFGDDGHYHQESSDGSTEKQKYFKISNITELNYIKWLNSSDPKFPTKYESILIEENITAGEYIMYSYDYYLDPIYTTNLPPKTEVISSTHSFSVDTIANCIDFTNKKVQVNLPVDTYTITVSGNANFGKGVIVNEVIFQTKLNSGAVDYFVVTNTQPFNKNLEIGVLNIFLVDNDTTDNTGNFTIIIKSNEFEQIVNISAVDHCSNVDYLAVKKITEKGSYRIQSIGDGRYGDTPEKIYGNFLLFTYLNDGEGKFIVINNNSNELITWNREEPSLAYFFMMDTSIHDNSGTFNISISKYQPDTNNPPSTNPSGTSSPPTNSSNNNYDSNSSTDSQKNGIDGYPIIPILNIFIFSVIIVSKFSTKKKLKENTH